MLVHALAIWMALHAGRNDVKPAPRRVYVVHSGVHTILANRDKNIAAKDLRQMLVQHGVRDQDIVVMSNPFPQASWKSMFPRKLAVMFALFCSPETELSQQYYVKLDQALREKNVAPADRIVWIGHSAGGQIGITMAHLAKHHRRFPNLAKRTRAYRFDMVITLGAPIGENLLPNDVKLRCYFSPSDSAVQWVAQYGFVVLWSLGHNVGIWITPPSNGHDFKMRIFRGIEHPNWHRDARVIGRVVREDEKEEFPWQTLVLGQDFGRSLAGLVAQSLDRACDMSLEDSPIRWQRSANRK